jgi:ribosomal-protein-alanine N-acetyltransferase
LAKLVRRTRNLVIRLTEPTDYEAWRMSYETMSDQVNRWDRPKRSAETLSLPSFKRILAYQKKLQKADQFFDFAVFDRKKKKMIGMVSVMNIQRGLGQTAYIGYFIHNKFWGRGYGKEATRALIDIAFRDLKLHRIEAGIEPQNRRSILLARSLGLRKEGLKKRAVYLRDQWIDLVMYSATCEEFGIPWKTVPATRLR